MRSVRLAFLFSCAVGCASASPPVARHPTPVQATKPVEPKPKPTPLPEFVDGADAVAALQALSELQIAQLRWANAKAMMRVKYGIDSDRGDGWDPAPDGRLKARRAEAAK